MASNLTASLLLVAMPFVPSSFLLLVVRPGAPSSVLAPSSNALSSVRFANLAPSSRARSYWQQEESFDSSSQSGFCPSQLLKGPQKDFVDKETTDLEESEQPNPQVGASALSQTACKHGR